MSIAVRATNQSLINFRQTIELRGNNQSEDSINKYDQFEIDWKDRKYGRWGALEINCWKDRKLILWSIPDNREFPSTASLLLSSKTNKFYQWLNFHFNISYVSIWKCFSSSFFYEQCIFILSSQTYLSLHVSFFCHSNLSYQAKYKCHKADVEI